MRKVILTTLALTLTTFASWPAGGVKVVQTPNGIQNPQMVYIEDGSVVISWEADRQIYCQKLDTTGRILWNPSGIRVCLNDSLQWPDHHMVTDGQDVWFVWQDERNDDGDIYAQKIDGSTGQRLWGDQGKVVCAKEGQQHRQACTVLSGGRFIASWTDYGVDPRDVAAQRFDANGQALWAPEGIYITRKTGGGNYPAVLPSGEAMVDVWHGIREGETEGAYFAQRIDSAGNFLWDTLGVLIEYALGFNGVCSDNAGGTIVLFDTGDGYAVQRVDSLGKIIWKPGGVKVLNYSGIASHALPPQSPPTSGLISDGKEGCFVWFIVPPITTSSSVQHVDSTSGIMWGTNGITYWTKKEEEEPLASTTLCSDGNNGVMVIFDNVAWGGMDKPYNVELGVWAQRINASGQKLFDTDGVIMKKWNPDSLPWGRFLLTATAIPGGVMTCWGDNRDDPNWSLYAQIIDTTGKVGSGIVEEPPFTEQLSLETQMDIASTLVSFQYSLPLNETGRLRVFDATGRLILSQKITQSKGIVTWDAKNIPSGVYFAQLATTNNTRVSRKVVVIK